MVMDVNADEWFENGGANSPRVEMQAASENICAYITYRKRNVVLNDGAESEA
jgi:hypothetical protein